MVSRINYGQEALGYLAEGTAELAGLLRHTYGPAGSKLLIGSPGAVPILVGNGNGIMEEMGRDHPGSAIARECAVRMMELEGNGTTTALLMLDALINRSCGMIAAGMNPVKLRKALTAETERVKAWLKAYVKMPADVPAALDMASGMNEEEKILIQKAFEGKTLDSIITVRDTRGRESFVESIGCVEIDQGYLTEEMITDPGEAAAELEYPYILLTDKVICHSEEIVPAMNIARKDGKPLFIMAQDVTGEALATLVVNIRNGKLRSAAVKATAYGERRRAILQDVAVMTGAAVVSEDFGDDLKRISREFMGGCDSLKVNAGHTLIYGGKGKTEDIKKRTDRIRAEIRTSVYEVDRINLRNRLARMEGGVSIINVGADTETEMREKRQRIKSSVALVKAILRQGAVAGGGISLYRAACELYKDGTAESTEKRGAQRLLKEMLQAPLRQLLLNSGYDAGQILKALDGLPWEYGFDVMRGRYTDMFEAGITDAAGTMCRAVETAISLAGTVITAGAVAELET